MMRNWASVSIAVLALAFPLLAEEMSSDPENGQNSKNPRISPEVSNKKKGDRLAAAAKARQRMREKAMARTAELTPASRRSDAKYLSLQTSPLVATPITSSELDEKLVAGETSEGLHRPKEHISEDQFVRRIYLDTIGRLPAPADIEEYIADRSPDKKAKLVDRLLASPLFGQRWGRYWRNVVTYRNTAGDRKDLPFRGDIWLAEQFNQNRPWDEIVSDMLLADGLSTETPQGFLWAAHQAKPAEMAGESARIFLGMQLSCAECHDHKTDHWKREQFHEFAAFFAGNAIRVRRDLSQSGPPVVELVQRPVGGPYRMPDADDPSKPGTVVQPTFLTGDSVAVRSSKDERVRVLAEKMTDPANPYFARAFVNRIWAELFGRGFIHPVDDLGEHQTPQLGEAFLALSSSFAASGYDVHWLYRTILNSEAYSRRFAPLDEADTALSPATIRPRRLSADVVFDSLDWVLGGLEDQASRGRRRFGARAGFERSFGFDPSMDATMVEQSVSQALTLMNHPQMAKRLAVATPGSLLSKVLKHTNNDRERITTLYLRVLGRKPQAKEMRVAEAYVKQLPNRAEAYEDLLWALLNSTEFLYNH